MNIFVAGLTGATGRLVAAQLIKADHQVIGYARNPKALPQELLDHPNLSVKQGALLSVDNDQLAASLKDIDGIACCLGHNLTREGIWGEPKRLVTDALNRLIELSPKRPIRVVLMSSNGVTHHAIQEKTKFGDQLVISLLSRVLPPQADNEQAAALLNSLSADHITWAVVRPDNLKDEAEVSPYQAFETRQKGVVFKSGFTSRINVAAFMSELLINDQLWSKWAGKWPVLYNTASLS
jgi:nucleoside-diphosphate-sugar epimerase